MLASSELIKIIVTDNGVTNDDMTKRCALDLIQPQVQMVDGHAFEYFLHACDCENNEDDEYYPHETSCAYLAGLWWVPLLLLFLLLLLCILCICCYYCCCAPVGGAAPVSEKTTYVYKERLKNRWK